MKENVYTSDNIKNFMLSNISNYKKNIDVSLDEIINNYLKNITEYMILLFENIHMKNLIHLKFILIRGLDSITTIFRLLLFFTQNMALTNYHTQKTFYVYIEFIEQISDVQNSFLQLSSRDAVLFVYKKTIFDINHEFRKNLKNDNIKNTLFKKIDYFINVYKNMICYYLQHPEFTLENKTGFIKTCCDNLKNMSHLILSSPKNKNIPSQNDQIQDNFELQILECIDTLIDKIYSCNLLEGKSISIICEIIEIFINKNYKNILNGGYNDIKKELHTIMKDDDIVGLL